jgi:2-polyprenyl-6-methoxyphenol hydroxylase-like FAD-dependent oxidoreductase
MTIDVVIAGAGPTGLMLACELRLAGVSPIVLERLPAPTGLSKGLGIWGRAIDALDHRGLLERFSEGLGPALTAFAHFGLIPLAPLGLERLSEAPPRMLPIQQARLEHLLEERARELGVEIRRGHELTGFHQDEEGVTVDVRGPAGVDRLRARFLVGCDGGGSAVRKLAGIAFPGTEPTSLLRLGDVKLPAELLQSSPQGGRPPFPPLGDGFYRVITREPYPPSFDRNAPMTLDELRESVRRTYGRDVPMSEPRWLSRFTDASRQAQQYRVGRVLLAGDAAHIHLPAGGPGITTGLLDATNLGWKLAAEVRGWASPTLLDTYHSERHPVGRRVIMHTRAQSVLMGPGEHVAAMRELFTELLRNDQTLRHIVDLLQQTDTHYEMDGRTLPLPDRHSLVGRWVPSLTIATAEGTKRVPELMHRARGVLLELAGRKALREIASGWSQRIDVVPARCAESTNSADALLIRPDGYVAWAAAPGESDEEARRALIRALTTWFQLGSGSAQSGACADR